jgi:hypothetical protein
MLHRDSTIQKCFRARRFSVPCQPSGRCVIPSGRPSVTAPSIRTPDRPSIIHSDDVLFCPEHPLCREVFVHLAFVWTSQQPVRTPLCTRSAPDSFQVRIKGRSINRPDARLHKARIAIQIHPSGRQTALVRMHVHQRRKLPIRFQPSGRLPLMVRMCA